MTLKTYKNCKDLYQKDAGATWQNLEKARTGDGYASYVYLKGSKSKTEYKPKDLVYRYATDFLDPSLWTIDASTFTIMFGKYKLKENSIPKIRVYVGKKGNNTFIREVSSYQKKDNVLEADTYTIQYNLGALTPQQWNKGIMIKLVWDKTRTTKESTISVNRARCSVKYHRNTSRIAIYSSLSPDNINTRDGAVWELTVKNTGDCDSTSLSLDIPAGCKLTDLGGNGVWDSADYPDELFFPNICRNQSLTHRFKLVFPYEGIYELNACNTWNDNPANQCVFEFANVFQYIPSDEVVYIFYPSYDNEDGYFDIIMQGEGNGHLYHCYNLSLPNNIEVDMPIRTVFEDLEGNVNVEEVNRNNTISYEYEGRTITIDLTDGMLCVKTDNPNVDFQAHVRIPFKAVSEGTGTITTHSYSNDKDYTGDLVVLPARPTIFVFDCEYSRDKSYVQNSVNIGIPDIWSIRCRSSRHNLFMDKKGDLEIPIEELIAYIGCIPLSRAHKRDVTSDVTNTLIDTRYLNRRYLGKEGNYLEKIGMTLRMKWQDVATLKGLLEMDKPIPIDTCPELPDGDPLNHRGWAELSEIKNIRKINDLLYECQPTVDYITHKLLTKFRIEPKDKLTDNTISYFLSETLSYNSDLLERFNLNYYQFYTNLEDDYGNYAGSYELPSGTNLTINSNDELNDYATYGLRFRNELPALMSEDYDNNWEMALRIRDKDTRQVLFEHLYNNFKHYDYDNNQVLNVADVTSKVYDGSAYNVLNYDKIALGYGDLALLLEDKKTITHFNTLDDTVFDDLNTNFELFLLDIDNNGLANEKVIIRVNDNRGYSNTFNVMTDIFGRIIFPMDFGNGDYDIQLIYEGTDKYRPCEYTVGTVIDYDEVVLHFEYSDNVIITNTGESYTFTVLDDNDDPVENIMIHYSYKDIGSDAYGYERTATSDTNGLITIPVDWTNGTKMLKVNMKGFVDNGTIYQPVSFEQEVNINIMKPKNLIIEADDIVLLQGDPKKDYYVKVTDDAGNPLSKDLIIGIYNKQESYVLPVTSNAQGVANAPLYLAGDSWLVDVHYGGDDTYNPQVISQEININKHKKLGSQLISENLELEEGGSSLYTITLLDEYNQPIGNVPVRITITPNVAGEDPYVDMVLYVDARGVLRIPYMTHDETVVITTRFYGNLSYDEVLLSDLVSFAPAPQKDVADVKVEGNKILQNWGGGWEELNYRTAFRIIVNLPGDNRTSYEGLNYYEHMGIGTFKVTLIYMGDSTNWHSCCRTLTLETIEDKRYANFIDIGCLGASHSPSSAKIGDLIEYRHTYNCHIPCSKAYLGVNVNGDTSNVTTLAGFKEHCDYVVMVKATHGQYTRFYSDIVVSMINEVQGNYEIAFFFEENEFMEPMISRMSFNVTSSSAEPVTLTQNGFGYLGQTYQDMNILAHNSNAGLHEKVNEYYIMKLTKIDTLEEYYFYSYLVDNTTISHIEYLLGLGDWQLQIFTKGTDNYQGSYYATTAELTEETRYAHIGDFFYDTDNWNEYGTEDITIDDSTISSGDSDNTIAVTDEYTDSNKYELLFKVDIGDNDIGAFMIGSDANQSETLIVKNGYITLIKNDNIIDEKIIDSNISGDWKISRDGDKWDIYYNNQLIYSTTELTYNTLGILNGPITLYGVYVYYEPVAEITPSVEDYDGTIFGSNIDISLRKNVLNLIDYGMLSEGDIGGGKVILSNITLPNANYELETDIMYNNSRFERLNDLKGKIQYRIIEDILTSNTELDYSKLLCSPVPIPDSITRFTRLSDEGRLYFVEEGKKGAKYLCNPYLQYKGGTDLKTETGISLFNLDGGYSPVYLSNGLVRAEFHRYSGYIVISRYDEKTQDWFICQTFHLHEEPNLEIVNTYSDDKATIRFGDTKWTMWRGRPFIKVEHEYDDLRILNLVNRVYCETIDNEFNMGYVEEHDATYSIFNPRMSIQLFNQELHIGENIRLDNFDLCLVDTVYNEYYDAAYTADITTQVVENENAIKLRMNSDSKIAVIFPSDAYVRKPAPTFSLLIDYLVQHDITSLKIKARGYGENGKVKENEAHQYGYWEDVQEITLGEEGEPDTIRATFKDVPDNVKYIDFMLIFAGSGGDVAFKDIMLYEGDSEDEETNQQGYDIDRSLANATRVELSFNETYYACLYDDDSPTGLAIARPNKQSFTLRNLTKSKETILIPYMKDYSEYDDVEKVFLEYLNSKDQVVNVEWRE